MIKYLNRKYVVDKLSLVVSRIVPSIESARLVSKPNKSNQIIKYLFRDGLQTVFLSYNHDRDLTKLNYHLKLCSGTELVCSSSICAQKVNLRLVIVHSLRRLLILSNFLNQNKYL